MGVLERKKDNWYASSVEILSRQVCPKLEFFRFGRQAPKAARLSTFSGSNQYRGSPLLNESSRLLTVNFFFF